MSAVIHVVTTLERGGAQRVVLETAARLHHEGRPQIVVTGARASDAASTLDDEAAQRLGARLVRLPSLVRPIDPSRDAVCVVELARLIDREIDRWRAPVVVHTH